MHKWENQRLRPPPQKNLSTKCGQDSRRHSRYSNHAESQLHRAIKRGSAVPAQRPGWSWGASSGRERVAAGVAMRNPRCGSAPPGISQRGQAGALSQRRAAAASSVVFVVSGHCPSAKCQVPAQLSAGVSAGCSVPAQLSTEVSAGCSVPAQLSAGVSAGR